MVCSIRRRALIGIALLAAIECGCATGAVLEWGRRVERPIEYRRAASDGERLYVAYRSEVRGHDGDLLDVRERGIAIRLVDLDPVSSHPVDAFPLQQLSEDYWSRSGARALSIVEERSDAGHSGGLLRIEARDGRPAGFLVEGVDGAAPGAHLRSSALIARHTAPWVWAVFPLALAYDAVAVPTLAILALPTFAGSK